jgi:CTP:molybdopterin cytidylyltransferase MocA
MTDTSVRILVLAGRRDGDGAVARIKDVSHKALAPVAGVTMLERVVSTLRMALPRAELGVAIDDGPDIAAVLQRLSQAGRIVQVPPEASPAATVAAAMTRLPPPLLIVAADHPLLTAEMVRHFLGHLPPGIDAAVAVARRETIVARYATKRTYWRFSDGSFSGCNLFYLGANGAARIVEFWKIFERERKYPWKAVRRLGPVVLLRFAFGRIDLAGVLDRLGSKTGTRLSAVEMPFAEAAIDVDRPADLDLAEDILRREVR